MWQSYPGVAYNTAAGLAVIPFTSAPRPSRRIRFAQDERDLWKIFVQEKVSMHKKELEAKSFKREASLFRSEYLSDEINHMSHYLGLLKPCWQTTFSFIPKSFVFLTSWNNWNCFIGITRDKDLYKAQKPLESLFLSSASQLDVKVLSTH